MEYLLQIDRQVKLSFPRKEYGLWPLDWLFSEAGHHRLRRAGRRSSVSCTETSSSERRWITEDTYKLSLALAQIMPGPLAAQTAIAIGYFEGGILGATLVGLGFILPSFFMVVAISLAYVAYGGLVVDAGALLCDRRHGHRHHCHCRLQARPQHQQA